ncbi:5'-nucleotidase C-terminal domain-containing protein [Streptomyces sp. NPDC048507]|uniref:5'-nucleotidase C-terminal domain-containing protein n=1 Tax=Streptomyces sp. NPDC048507 TaxID=3365560 RepID=UPI0037132B87
MPVAPGFAERAPAAHRMDAPAGNDHPETSQTPVPRTGSCHERTGLNITDLHGYLGEPPARDAVITGAGGRRFTVGGAAHLATHLQRLRAGRADEPTVEALNPLGLDFATAGNHEFDRTPGFLVQHMERGRPHTGEGSTNTVTAGPAGTTVLAPYHVEYVRAPGGRRLPLGFIHLTAVGTEDFPNSFRPGLTTLDERSAFDSGTDPSGPAYELALRASADIDAIVTGHWHCAFTMMLPDPAGRPRPFEEAGRHGQIVNELTLRLPPDPAAAAPTWRSSPRRRGPAAASSTPTSPSARRTGIRSASNGPGGPSGTAVSGRQLHDAPEQQWAPDARGTLTYAPLAVSGNVRHAFDPAGPVGGRVAPADVLIGGSALRPDGTYRVVTTSYTLTGQDGYPGLGGFRAASSRSSPPAAPSKRCPRAGCPSSPAGSPPGRRAGCSRSTDRSPGLLSGPPEPGWSVRAERARAPVREGARARAGV